MSRVTGVVWVVARPEYAHQPHCVRAPLCATQRGRGAKAKGMDVVIADTIQSCKTDCVNAQETHVEAIREAAVGHMQAGHRRAART